MTPRSWRLSRPMRGEKRQLRGLGLQGGLHPAPSPAAFQELRARPANAATEPNPAPLRPGSSSVRRIRSNAACVVVLRSGAEWVSVPLRVGQRAGVVKHLPLHLPGPLRTGRADSIFGEEGTVVVSRAVRTQPGRQGPAHGPVEVPRGALGWSDSAGGAGPLRLGLSGQELRGLQRRDPGGRQPALGRRAQDAPPLLRQRRHAGPGLRGAGARPQAPCRARRPRRRLRAAGDARLHRGLERRALARVPAPTPRRR